MKKDEEWLEWAKKIFSHRDTEFAEIFKRFFSAFSAALWLNIWASPRNYSL
jgi:hypothetical protein